MQEMPQEMQKEVLATVLGRMGQQVSAGGWTPPKRKPFKPSTPRESRLVFEELEGERQQRAKDIREERLRQEVEKQLGELRKQEEIRRRRAALEKSRRLITQRAKSMRRGSLKK